VSGTLRTARRAVVPGALAFSLYLLVFSSSSGLTAGVLLCVLATVCVAAPMVWEVFTDGDRGTPAPAEIQKIADECAVLLGATPCIVAVAHGELGFASLRGLTPGTRQIRIAPGVIHAPTATIRAIIAHEYAHLVSHHQLISGAAALVSWLVPSVLAAFAAEMLGRTLFIEVGLAYAAATVGCMIAWCHAMRQQELAADALAARCPGVRAALTAHLSDINDARPGVDLFAVHPAASYRLERLGAARPTACATS
jgi:Zn-dependent protease with chaperone function